MTFVAHVRYASTGKATSTNADPFTMNGRIMAHNGGFSELGRLEEQLGRYCELVQGDTDSERYFALITQQIDAHDGDVGAGITAAARWIGERLPLSSLNTIVATAGELWALRYPGQHALHMIERPAGASSPPAPNTRAAAGTQATTGSPPGTGAAAAGLHARSATSSAPRSRAARTALGGCGIRATRRGVRLADAGSRRAGPRVRADLTVESAVVIPEAPAHLVPLPSGGLNIDS